jgi:hypothetical protein
MLRNELLAHLHAFVVLNNCASLAVELHSQRIEHCAANRPDDCQRKDESIKTAPRVKRHSSSSFPAFLPGGIESFGGLEFRKKTIY